VRVFVGVLLDELVELAALECVLEVHLMNYP
jgi:hypothetical protein